MGERIAEGALVGERFELQLLLGTGATGAVWLARDRSTSETVALKILHEHIRSLLAGREQLRREAELLGRLDHPNLARPIAFAANEEMAYMAMELAQGVPLSRLLGDHAATKRHFTASEIVSIMTQMCAAVQSAHDANIVHRDLKPQNVMIDATKNEPVVKVLDFGVARLVANNSFDATTLGRRIGSLFYMSPEQLRGQAAGAPSDVFSLGTIMFELITLRRAWALNELGSPASAFDRPIPRIRENSYQQVMERILRGPRPRASESRRDLSWSIDELLFGALAIKAEDRIKSATELASRLLELKKELPRTTRSGPFDAATDSMNETLMPTDDPFPDATETNARMPAAPLEPMSDPRLVTPNESAPPETMTNAKLQGEQFLTMTNPQTPATPEIGGAQTVTLDKEDLEVGEEDSGFYTLNSEEIEELDERIPQDLVQKILETSSEGGETIHEDPGIITTSQRRPASLSESPRPSDIEQAAFPPLGPTIVADSDGPVATSTRIIQPLNSRLATPLVFERTPSETSPDAPVFDPRSLRFLGLVVLAVVGVVAGVIAILASN